MKTVSVVIPAKDEADTLGGVLTELNETIAAIDGYAFDVLLVDDHSSDATADIARSHGARVHRRREARSGKGLALRDGFSRTDGDILVMMDADYSHQPRELPYFLRALEQPDVGLVIGSRVTGGSEEYTHVRALGNVFLSGILGLCTRRYLSDALNGFKVFRRDVFDDFEYTSKAFEIEIEIIANTLRKGYRILEVNSHELARAGGREKSKVVRHGTRFLLRIFWERFRGIEAPEVSRPSTLGEGVLSKEDVADGLTRVPPGAASDAPTSTR